MIDLNSAALHSLRQALTDAYPSFQDFTDHPGTFGSDERKYKDELVALYRSVLRPVLEPDLIDSERAREIVRNARTVLTKVLPDGRPQNLVNWRYFDFLSGLNDDESVAFARALRELVLGAGDSPERLAQFNIEVQPIMAQHGQTGAAITRSFPTLFLMLENPLHDIYIRTELMDKAFLKLTGKRCFDSKPLDAATYSRVLTLVRSLFETLTAWGMKPRDLIDIQSFLWVTVSSPSPAPPPPPPNHHFDHLLNSLASSGLYFPTELVSNYVLALQTRRFVILTGISGTGKTQMAMAVAEHFSPTAPTTATVAPPNGSVIFSVHPYMLAHHRLVVPVALASQLRLPPIDPMTNGGSIVVEYGDSQQALTFWKDPTRNVTTIHFSGEFRRWFTKTFQAGQPIQLSILEVDEDAISDGLRLTIPDPLTQTTLTKHVEVIAVRPDWTDNRGLLGFFNPIVNSYVTTPFLDLLLEAKLEADTAKNPRPYFVILDEMNLARVEHYFSDFLSCLESGQPLHLHNDPIIEAGEGGDAVPRKLTIPANLFFTGTVNIDETTYMFSPKVLDRAFTLELNDVNLEALCIPQSRRTVDSFGLNSMPELPQQLGKVTNSDWTMFYNLLEGDLRDMVLALHTYLAQSNRHFGYRVANEIARFVNLAAEQAGRDRATLWTALDLALLQKVLPKLNGTQQEVEKPLCGLFAIAITGNPNSQQTDPELVDWHRWEADGSQIRLRWETIGDTVVRTGLPMLPRMGGKVYRMLVRLQSQGFTSFIE